MPTAIQSFESGSLNALAELIQANSAPIEAAIASGEVDLQGVVVKLLSSIPKAAGLAGTIEAPIENAVFGAVEAYVAGVFKQYTPAQIVAWFVGLLQGEAKRIGG